MDIEIVKEFLFDSAHFLPGHPGKCKGIHGHTYKLQVGIRWRIDPDTGMVDDFGNIKKIVNESIIEKLDHKFLNEVYLPGFPAKRPTAELMVEWIVKELRSKFAENFADKLSLVRLYETPTSYAEWRKSRCS